jgi:hypothetical protein
MDSVVAKFTVSSVEDFGSTKTAKLKAVSDPKGEYKHFTQYTPYGEMSIGISSDALASTFFVPGEILTLTFSK